jgi:hypothetical protein
MTRATHHFWVPKIKLIRLNSVGIDDLTWAPLLIGAEELPCRGSIFCGYFSCVRAERIALRRISRLRLGSSPPLLPNLTSTTSNRAQFLQATSQD